VPRCGTSRSRTGQARQPEPFRLLLSPAAVQSAALVCCAAERLRLQLSALPGHGTSAGVYQTYWRPVQLDLEQLPLEDLNQALAMNFHTASTSNLLLSSYRHLFSRGSHAHLSGMEERPSGVFCVHMDLVVILKLQTQVAPLSHSSAMRPHTFLDHICVSRREPIRNGGVDGALERRH
jgi:hypothetical protein